MICVSITSIEKYQHLHGSITMDEYSLWFDTPTVNNNIRRYLVHLYGTEEERERKKKLVIAVPVFAHTQIVTFELKNFL